MGTVVECDPAELSRRAGAWLEGEPVLHNVICTVLSRAQAEPGKFGEAAWLAVDEDGKPVGGPTRRRTPSTSGSATARWPAPGSTG